MLCHLFVYCSSEFRLTSWIDGGNSLWQHPKKGASEAVEVLLPFMPYQQQLIGPSSEDAYIYLKTYEYKYTCIKVPISLADLLSASQTHPHILQLCVQAHIISYFVSCCVVNLLRRKIIRLILVVINFLRVINQRSTVSKYYCFACLFLLLPRFDGRPLKCCYRRPASKQTYSLTSRHAHT